MENQINVGDQNTQQIGQNLVSQQVLSPEKPKANYLSIGGVILACFVVFGFGGYYLGKQSTNLQQNSNNTQSLANLITTPDTGIPTTSPTSISKKIEENTFNNQYFSFVYPKNWSLENTYIFEHRSDCDPDTYRCLNEKNIVDIRSNTTQIYQGYTNSEWLNKIGSLTSPWESGRDIFAKLASGQTQEGKEYIIFKQSPSPTFEGEPLTLINGYVLNDNHIYELRLSHFSSDSEAIQILKSMLMSLAVK